MLEKPNLQDESIASCLREQYEIGVTNLEFLPIGNDATAWVYHVHTGGERDLFLKVKKGGAYAPSLLVPHFLKEQGLHQIVAPIADTSGKLSQPFGEFSLILYPLINGQTGAETGLTEAQWTEFGALLRRIHETSPTPQLAKEMRRETFAPQWALLAKELHVKVMNDEYAGPDSTQFERELAIYWKEKSDEISRIVARTEELGRLLQDRTTEFVLCHADIHTSNLLVTPDEQLFVVDWDETIIAPKERDLMFFVDKIAAGRAIGDKNSDCFFAGYGGKAIDPVGISYYRYEWVVQEIGDFGKRVFLSSDGGEETKKAALCEFIELFEQGDVVDGAYASEEFLT